MKASNLAKIIVFFFIATLLSACPAHQERQASIDKAYLGALSSKKETLKNERDKLAPQLDAAATRYKGAEKAYTENPTPKTRAELDAANEAAKLIYRQLGDINNQIDAIKEEIARPENPSAIVADETEKSVSDSITEEQDTQSQIAPAVPAE